MKINIISKNNGVGLSTDINLLKCLLSNHDINFIHHANRNVQHADINIHVELVGEHQFKSATKNILIPNPEWYFDQWIKYIPSFDLILAKTHYTEEIFTNLKGRVVYSGWTSYDMHADVIKKRAFLHWAGKSSEKNTIETYHAMNKSDVHGIIQQIDLTQHSTNNIQVINKFITKESLKEIFNSCAFHICCSQVEGFGHYIWEGLSCGAIMITTLGRPMNEYPNNYLVPSCNSYKIRQAMANKVTSEEIMKAIILVNNMTDNEINICGNRNRELYLQNDLEFKQRFSKIFANL